MKLPSPVLQALAAYYEGTQAGRTGRGGRDVIVPLEELLERAGAREGDAREMAERQLRTAAGQGWISLEPVHRRDPGSIGRVRLAPAQEQVLFAGLGISSPTEVRRQWSALFLEAEAWSMDGRFAPLWKPFCRTRAEKAAYWDAMAPFRRGDLAGGRELLGIVARLLQWTEGEHFMRAASCRVCGDSKRLERQRGALETLLAEATAGELQTFAGLGILDTPRHVLAAGPLTLSLDGRVLDLAGLRDGASLAASDLERAELHTDARRCVTVENKTSFHQRALEHPEELVIHTSYPNSAVLILLGKLQGTMEFFHWGDTDPTGFDILRDLRASTKLPIQSLQMQYRPGGGGGSLSPEERRLVHQLLEEPLLATERSALRALIEAGAKGIYEQEHK